MLNIATNNSGGRFHALTIMLLNFKHWDTQCICNWKLLG